MTKHQTFNYGKTAGELTFAEAEDIMITLESIVASILRFDNVTTSVRRSYVGAQLSVSVDGYDLFNVQSGSTECARAYDIKDDRLSYSVGVPFDESMDGPLNKLIEHVCKFRNRQTRERRHMAFILKGQHEQMGHYSPELVEAFQSAFRKSMEDAGLLALADLSEVA